MYLYEYGIQNADGSGLVEQIIFAKLISLEEYEKMIAKCELKMLQSDMNILDIINLVVKRLSDRYGFKKV